MKIQGGCLCGNVQYEVKGPLSHADHCHCSMCRRQHGAAFGTYANFNPDSFSWVAGESYIKIYQLSSGNGWCFCRECGSTLGGTEKGEITSITMGTVVGDPGVKPESHIYVGSMAQWYEIQDDLPRFEEES